MQSHICGGVITHPRCVTIKPHLGGSPAVKLQHGFPIYLCRHPQGWRCSRPFWIVTVILDYFQSSSSTQKGEYYLVPSLGLERVFNLLLFVVGRRWYMDLLPCWRLVHSPQWRPLFKRLLWSACVAFNFLIIHLGKPTLFFGYTELGLCLPNFLCIFFSFFNNTYKHLTKD